MSIETSGSWEMGDAREVERPHEGRAQVQVGWAARYAGSGLPVKSPCLELKNEEQERVGIRGWVVVTARG